MSLPADKLQMCKAVRTIYGFVNWCEADIFFPNKSRKLRGPLSVLWYVKHTEVPLAVQYNTAPLSIRYTSPAPSGPDQFWSHRSRQIFVQLLQTEYKQHSACTGIGSLLYCFKLLEFEFKIIVFKLKTLRICINIRMNICNDICIYARIYACLYLNMDIYVHNCICMHSCMRVLI